MKAFPVTLVATLSWLIFETVTAYAINDCPTAVTGRGSFIVERGQESKTEVVR